MTRHVFALAFCAAALLRPAFTAAAEQDQPAPLAMTLHAAIPPRPALRYPLLPPLLDQTPGNAAPLYLKAFLSQAQSPLDAEAQKKLDAWLALPADKLPRDEVKAILQTRESVLHQAALAARRADCEWDLPLREEKNWFEILLPELQEARAVGKLLALRSRVETTEGRIDDAITTLQQGFALARHVADAPTLVNGLVGVSIAGLMFDTLERLIQAPQAPNLYWSLAALPDPMIDLSASVPFEAEGIYLLHPELHAARRKQLTAAEWDPLLDRTAASLESLLPLVQVDGKPGPRLTKPGELRELLLAAAPQARLRLATHGHGAKQVEAMPAAQAVLQATMDIYEDRRDEILCRWAIPYWEAKKLRTARPATTDRQDDVLGVLAILVADLERVKFKLAHNQQRIAVLRCLEALRLHAAEHGGKLPTTLGEITAVSVPTSPITGEPFGYRVDGDTATLVAPSGDEKPARTYRIRMKRAE